MKQDSYSSVSSKVRFSGGEKSKKGSGKRLTQGEEVKRKKYVRTTCSADGLSGSAKKCKVTETEGRRIRRSLKTGGSGNPHRVGKGKVGQGKTPELRWPQGKP